MSNFFENRRSFMLTNFCCIPDFIFLVAKKLKLRDHLNKSEGAKRKHIQIPQIMVGKLDSSSHYQNNN